MKCLIFKFKKMKKYKFSLSIKLIFDNLMVN